MQETFRKDLSHLPWDEVYARQVKRAPLVGDWIGALRLTAGDHVLDVGSGPGFVSLALADQVGPTGLVYAVDPAAEAIAYLERLAKERGISNIKAIVADAAKLALASAPIEAALISMVLHHCDDPAGIIRNVARLLSPGRLAVIAEFHPDGPCEQGPPRDHRLAPHQVRMWCETGGFRVTGERRQTPEHYMLLVQRPS